jgi:hypothetical protein
MWGCGDDDDDDNGGVDIVDIVVTIPMVMLALVMRAISMIGMMN